MRVTPYQATGPGKGFIVYWVLGWASAELLRLCRVWKPYLILNPMYAVRYTVIDSGPTAGRSMVWVSWGRMIVGGARAGVKWVAFD